MFRVLFASLVVLTLLAAGSGAKAQNGVEAGRGGPVDVRAADAQMFPEGITYNASVPTPAKFLGFELGRHPVRVHQMADYLQDMAARSDRISIETIGYSHERRPILFLVITSPENHARLDEIQQRHVALSEPDQNQAVTEDMPVITWLNYGVHGAESSGLDSVLPVVYHLAAAEDEDTRRLLDESVILITAVFNPDGHANRINWFDRFGGERMIANPDHLEHEYSWSDARTNHYGFDLNRQWLLLTQPEPRAWMTKWHAWRPNLTVDYHEMGPNSTYYFHPGVRTRTNPLVPQQAETLMEQTAARSEDFLDSEARLYFHGESFDNFYVGKGSTFPLVNGGVGVLFEAGAARGREIETPNGLRTYRENIRKHFMTSIAIAQSAVDLRADYLQYQKSFYADALQAGRDASTAAWVVTAEGDQTRLHFFADLLARHRIKTFRLGEDLERDGSVFRASESLLIPADQPQHTLIRSLFENPTSFEDNTFYDVSSWTMPPAFGLPFAALGERSLRGNVLGEAWVPPLPSAGPPPPASYGYLFEWSPYFAPRALNRLLEAGVMVRAARKPSSLTTTEGVRNFERGAMFVPFDRQTVSRDTIHDLVTAAAEQDGIKVYAVESGVSANSTEGINPGGPGFVTLRAPQILLLTGAGVSTYDSGEVWHLLDYRMHIPVTLRERDQLGSIDWNRYTHMVFPGGDWEAFEPEFGDRLRQWVKGGGTVVGLRQAAPWLRQQTLDWTEPDLTGTETNAAMPAQDTAPEEAVVSERISYADLQATEAKNLMGGVIFRGDLDFTHPMGFGYDNREIFLHKNVSKALSRPENPFAVVIEYTAEPLFAGYSSAENIEALAGTPALVAERSGGGSVVLFADNPNFRGYWYGNNKLFLNSLFFSTLFEAPDL